MNERTIKITVEVPVATEWPRYHADQQHELLRVAVGEAIKALHAATTTATPMEEA